MEARKLQVKFFVESDGLDLEPYIPVLHAWIKNKALDDLLIDVADYSHVADGPGLLLVGHASDYYLDQHQGRTGLLYGRKRDAADDPEERVVDALKRALVACKKLEDEASLSNKPKFKGDEILFRVNDRLQTKNDDESFAAIRPVLEAAFEKLYGDTAFSMEREGEPRELLTVRVKAPGAPGVGDLLARLS